MRRVVVTGLAWFRRSAAASRRAGRNLHCRQSGAAAITDFEVDDLPARSPARFRAAPKADGTFNPDDWLEPKESARSTTSSSTGWRPPTRRSRMPAGSPRPTRTRSPTGVLIGSGIGGIDGIEEPRITLQDAGRAASARSSFPAASSIWRPARCRSATAQGAEPRRGHRLLDRRARHRRRGAADHVRRCRRHGGRRRRNRRSAGLSLAGFAACRALSTDFNDRPTEASRPYDRDRDGFVMGEGAGVVVLEELEHAKARGARIYAEVIGYGLSGDAYHITAPAEDGDGAYRCMRMALKRAGIAAGRHRLHQRPRHLDAARRRDRASGGRAAGRQRRRQSRMSSTKSAIGHLLGAAGAVEAIFSILAIRDNIAPPTLNLDNPSVETAIDLVPHTPKKTRDRRRAVQLVRLRRHQRLAGLPAPCLIGSLAILLLP